MDNTFIYILCDCKIADYYMQFNSKIRNIADFKNQLRRYPYKQVLTYGLVNMEGLKR